MNPRVYDVAVLAGVVLCSAGAWVQWGMGMALMVAGGLVLAVTFTGAFVGGKD